MFKEQLRGLEGLRADNRMSRRHYGFEISMPFQKGIDIKKWSYVDQYDGKRYAPGYIIWMVAKVLHGLSLLQGQKPADL